MRTSKQREWARKVNAEPDFKKQCELACKAVEDVYGIEHGIEGHAFNVRNGFTYVNRGDPYAETLISWNGKRWYWGAWGDRV